MNKLSFSRIGFFCSYNGSSMRAIVGACKDGRLGAEPACVISNNHSAGALEFAKKYGIVARHLSKKTLGDDAAVDVAAAELLQEVNADLVVLSGYMRPVGPSVLDSFRGRVLNIHPALLPEFGGKGMYGTNVHRAVLAAGEKESGITIHLVDAEYDSGPIVAQCRIKLAKDETVETLEARVREREPSFFVETLQQLQSN